MEQPETFKSDNGADMEKIAEIIGKSIHSLLPVGIITVADLRVIIHEEVGSIYRQENLEISQLRKIIAEELAADREREEIKAAALRVERIMKFAEIGRTGFVQVYGQSVPTMPVNPERSIEINGGAQ